ncbi:hypothetical protein Cni_G11543 [Canna indica]|uniref:HHO5-like N-terminal domain-containing protein n=1 Tax=Canna indica TaxID=4628 RepID=A0AAQ3K807_9LILI|nr:hypothetical protein Cni_G11543 [Canna indica]
MAMMMDLMGRKLRCRHDYIRELEEERRKIEAFQRELPLCLELLTQAIEIVRQQMCDDDEEEKPTSRTPVLEEFIPLKLSSTMAEMMMMMETAPEAAAGSETTPDWLRSVQLWNQEPDTALKVEPPKKPIAVSLKNTGGAFQPFEKGAKKRIPPPPAAAASSASSGSGGDCSGNGGDNNKEKESKEWQSKSTQRKERRCWSPELHRRFLNALHQLGGCHEVSVAHNKKTNPSSS